MKHKLISVFALAILLAGLLAPARPVIAQEPPPPKPSKFYLGFPISFNYPGGTYDSGYSNLTMQDDFQGWYLSNWPQPGECGRNLSFNVPADGYYSSYWQNAGAWETNRILNVDQQGGLQEWGLSQGIISVYGFGGSSNVDKDDEAVVRLEMSGPCNPGTMVFTPVYYGSNYPEPVCDDTVGSFKAVDLLDTGTVTAGSLEAYDYTTDQFGNNVQLLTFNLDAPLPEVSYGEEGRYKGYLRYTASGTNLTPNPAQVTVNGQLFEMSSGTSVPVSIPSGVSSLSITFSEMFTEGGGNPGPEDQNARVDTFKLLYPAVNNGENILCDGGLERIPEESPWVQTDDTREFIRYYVEDFISPLFNGQPACGYGNQILGHTITTFFATGDGSPISQRFLWNGGTAYYKFRYKSGVENIILSIFRGSPNVYLVNDSGVIVADLIGDNSHDEGLISQDWLLYTGSLVLNPGYYTVVLDQGYKFGVLGLDLIHSGRVFYDDVSIGTVPQDTECSDWIEEPPDEEPTMTPTPLNSPTATPTPTGTLPTPLPGTPSGTPKGTPTRTSTARPTGTQRATATRTLTRTPPATTATAQAEWTQYWQSQTAMPTKTPYGTPRPTNTPVPGTPEQNTNTPVPLPSAGLPPLQNTPPHGTGPGTGWNPIGTPGSGPGWGLPGGGPGQVSCSYECERPGFLEPAHWIDYGVCEGKRYTCWGSEHNATAVAIFAQFGTYEPFGSIVEVAGGIQSARTQIAGAVIQSGAEGVYDPISPQADSILKSSGTSHDPWAENAPLLTSNLFGNNLGFNGYTPYCSTRLSSLLSARLAAGLCYVLNIMRKIGYLPWVQFFINILAILMIIKTAVGVFIPGGMKQVVRSVGEVVVSRSGK